jgi:hypothetical protein
MAVTSAPRRVGLAWESADTGRCFGERCRVVFSTFDPRLII